MFLSSLSTTLQLALFTGFVFVVIAEDVTFKIGMNCTSYSGTGESFESTAGEKSYVITTVTAVNQETTKNAEQSKLDMTQRFIRYGFKAQDVHYAFIKINSSSSPMHMVRITKIKATDPNSGLTILYQKPEFCNLKVILDGTTYYSSVEVCSDDEDLPYLILLDMEILTSQDAELRFKKLLDKCDKISLSGSAIYPTGTIRETGIAEKCGWLPIDITKIVPGIPETTIFYKFHKDENFELQGKFDLLRNVLFKFFIPDTMEIVGSLSVARLFSKTKPLSLVATSHGWNGLLSLSNLPIDHREEDMKQFLQHPEAQFSIQVGETWYLLKQFDGFYNWQSTFLVIVAAQHEPKWVIKFTITPDDKTPCSDYYGYAEKKEDKEMGKYLEVKSKRTAATYNLSLYQMDLFQTSDPYSVQISVGPTERAEPMRFAALAHQSFVPAIFSIANLNWSIIQIQEVKPIAGDKTVALLYKEPKAFFVEVIIITGPTSTDEANMKPKVSAYIYSFDEKKIVLKPQRDGVEELNQQLLLEWVDIDTGKNIVAESIFKKLSGKLFVRGIGDKKWKLFHNYIKFMGTGFKLLGMVAPTEVLFWIKPENSEMRIIIRCTIDQLAETVTVQPFTKATEIPVSSNTENLQGKAKTVKWKKYVREKNAVFGVCWLASSFNENCALAVSVQNSNLSPCALMDRNKHLTIIQYAQA